jgi:fatty acid desaturase
MLPVATAYAQETEASEVCEGDCCPPNTAQQVFIGVGTLVVAVIAFLLLPRIVERAAINKGRSPLSARHAGISLALLLTMLGLLGIVYAVTGCLATNMLIAVAVVGAIWALHGIYALVAVK